MQASVELDENLSKGSTIPDKLDPDDATRVVVIGAGLAGLATVQRLHERGIRDVIVLEAHDRVGGRVHTVAHQGQNLELGAQWLHGADENPLYSWLMDLDMLNDFEDVDEGFDGLFCSSRGQRIDNALVKKVINVLFETRLSLSKNHLQDLVGTQEFKTASSVFKHLLDEQVEKDQQLKDNEELVYSIYDWYLRYECIENSCDTMDEVSIASYTDWTDSGDGSLINLKHGYISLLNWFLSKVTTKDCIYLNRKVTNIEKFNMDTSRFSWLDEEGNRRSRPMLVKYTTTDQMKRGGDTSQDMETKQNIRQLECDHVVVTCSLGYLKKHQDTLFKPPLSDIKRDLINSLGFGTVNKIVLEFESPFWRDEHGIKLVWHEQDRLMFPRWSHDIASFEKVRHHPNLLIGWIGGEGARLMEDYTDQEVSSTCMNLLQRFLPDSHKPSKLTYCLCSRWSSNPFICGSYSFRSVASLNKSVEKLHEPIYDGTTCSSSNKLTSTSQTSRIPRILFAGEATAGRLYSTTHGAIISGWREADRLIDYLMASSNGSASVEPKMAVEFVPV